ncbi:hypothetical protein SZ63_01115 [Methanoculleus sediminis]|uniref:Uncharacterized protein n=1 Tax=Methanoculleus sediminis TaxID=1550566 RepID=A0A0H1R222_9EURY|nr:hypothetical protein [Methanoculleus sediminis]KLK89084.1 hypothetical protein SZ63_01115 [Methanoculleus sediminis]
MTGYTPPEYEREVMAVMVEGRHAKGRRTNRVVLNHRGPDERETMARGIIRRILVQFHREWDELRERESGSARVLASNAMLDRYSHQLYNTACDMRGVLGEELAGELRCLSADVIMAANILIMLGCGEECREESETLAEEALLRIERCLALVQKGKGCPATWISAAHREE